MSRLQGKVAVITGGNSGIGRTTAEAFAREGAKVVIFGRNQTTLDEAVAALGDNGFGVQGDVTDHAALSRLFTETESKFGKIDILFVNAGIAPFAPVDQVDDAFYDKVMDINVKGVFFTVQKSLGHLNEGASIILTSSVVNVMGMPAGSVYSASKAAVRSLGRSFASELGARNIRVNVLSPGPIATPIFDRMGLSAEAKSEMGDAILAQVPMKRFGDPQEIAEPAVFLASDASTYMTGAEIQVDGGMVQL